MARALILTGFMGTGKSSVGKIVAKMTGRRYMDLDRIIVERTGRTITEIFDNDGESCFRKEETEALRETIQASDLVLSTGGGAVLAGENRALMRGAGAVVNLTASPEVILKRIESCEQRPLLRDRKTVADIARMLAEREQCYAEADIRIDTDAKTMEDVAAEILSFLKEKQRLGPC
jgi:shikimate kinase